MSEYLHIQRASENYKQVDEILNDTYRLLSRFYGIIRSSALHIYHSALNFTPLGTHLHQMYSSRFPNRIIARQGVPQHWSPLVAVPHGHSRSVNVLSFSPDGSRLASGSHDNTVRLWDGASGIPIATLEGHSHCNIVLHLYYSRLTGLDLLRDPMTTKWDYGIVLQEYQLPPLRVTPILLVLYHSRPTGLNLFRDRTMGQWNCGIVLQERQLSPLRVTGPHSFTLYHSCTIGARQTQF